MIRGRFVAPGPAIGGRPFVTAVVRFSALGNRPLRMYFLIDTGADRTILGPRDAARLQGDFGLDLAALPPGRSIHGVGGQAPMRTIDTVISFPGSATTIAFPNLPLMLPTRPPRPIPSLLGRDILARFALFMEERTGRVLLLEPGEANRLPADLLPLP